MARALLKIGFFTYRSPHRGSNICRKKINSFVDDVL